MSTICVDANIIIGLITGRPKYIELWESWVESAVDLVAPTLINYEIVNALHRYFVAGQLSEAQVNNHLQDFFDLNITTYQDEALHQQATLIARQHSLPAAYDAHYLALAERLSIDFWTADRRLAQSSARTLSWLKFFSES